MKLLLTKKQNFKLDIESNIAFSLWHNYLLQIMWD